MLSLHVFCSFQVCHIPYQQFPVDVHYFTFFDVPLLCIVINVFSKFESYQHIKSNGPNDCQESQVHQRISELRKEGQWSASRLPKLVEASRPKSHWDYLLEEMQWMAADFAQERRWKEAAAKKV